MHLFFTLIVPISFTSIRMANNSWVWILPSNNSLNISIFFFSQELLILRHAVKILKKGQIQFWDKQRILCQVYPIIFNGPYLPCIDTRLFTIIHDSIGFYWLHTSKIIHSSKWSALIRGGWHATLYPDSRGEAMRIQYCLIKAKYQ